VRTDRSELPRSCRPEPVDLAPVVDRNRCEAKGDCEAVCPYGVFDVRRLTTAERDGVSLRGRLNLLVHGGRQAVVARPGDCRACGLCVKSCPERAIRLLPTDQAGTSR
jgi:NAD-dependent dihydropyrimidine dehydrogenase PreA subunit